MSKFIFTNILGCFVFNKNHKLEDKILFKTKDDFEKKEETLKKLEKKHDGLSIPEGNDRLQILHHFKTKEYQKSFREKNIVCTKTAIKESVTPDNLIIQTIDSMEEIDRVVNLLSKRLREWYALYCPEVEFAFESHEHFVDAIANKTKEQLLKQIKVKEEESMGKELSKDDLSALKEMISQVQSLYELNKKQEHYLEKIEKKFCPNLMEIGGVTITAKLIAHAGSLKRLAQMPASTLQVLGAEKALFRHLRNKKKHLPPKYGLLHEHQLIQKSHHKDHGKVARALADKLSFAARIDHYKGEFKADQYKKELIDKFGIQF